MAAVSLMQQARTAIREGRLVEACRLLRQVIHEEPLNHAAWLLLAKATPDRQVAAQYIERAQQLQPQSPLVQQAQEGLHSRKTPTSSGRNLISGRAFVLLAGVLLLLGAVVVTLGGGLWQQVTALQSEAGSSEAIAAAALAAGQRTPFQRKNMRPLSL